MRRASLLLIKKASEMGIYIMLDGCLFIPARTVNISTNLALITLGAYQSKQSHYVGMTYYFPGRISLLVGILSYRQSKSQFVRDMISGEGGIIARDKLGVKGWRLTYRRMRVKLLSLN